ncbi:MAG: long-chain fatty acid transport protein [Myxococcota bacterium]|jgi:long-chain fatty acid transport protein
MNKATTFLLCASMLTVMPRESAAGSIDYLTNQSADYIRLLGRNASTDGPDIVAYNPAGLSFLPRDGLYLSLSNQMAFKSFEITYKDEVFGAFTVPAGGGRLTYEKGVPFLIPLGLQVPGGGMPTNGVFEGSSMFLAGTVGASYGFADMISVSAAARVISSRKTFIGQAQYTTSLAKLDATKTALGVGGIFGLHIRPLRQLDIGIRYETETALEFETESTTSNLKTEPNTALAAFADGAKEKRNLPATLGVGIAYHVMDQLTLMGNFNYYFINEADSADDIEGNLGYVISYDDDYDNGIEIAFSVEYAFLPELVASIGYDRAWSGGNENTFSDFEFHLSSHAVGGGARYTLFDRLDLSVGFAAIFYDEAQNETVHPLISVVDPRGEPFHETYNKQNYVLALSVGYRLFGDADE